MSLNVSKIILLLIVVVLILYVVFCLCADADVDIGDVDIDDIPPSGVEDEYRIPGETPTPPPHIEEVDFSNCNGLTQEECLRIHGDVYHYKVVTMTRKT